jgi:hypothetical protein
MMKFVGPDGSELIMVTAVDRDGDKLVIKGKVFGAMPISARLSPDEARRGLKLLNFRVWLFLLTFLLRR